MLLRAMFLLPLSILFAANPELETSQWPAFWIHPEGSLTEFGVYHFRKTVDLAAKPATFVVHVTADNRYQLFVNGQRVASGPARGDLFHWRYESVDLAPHLHAGRNALAAVVWNFAADAPMAQVTWQTGFLLQGDTAAERIADTNRTWKYARNAAYTPIPFSSGAMRGYYVAGPGERVDAARYPWGWEQADFDDSAWKDARQGDHGAPRDARDPHSAYMLLPRNIPMMEEKAETQARVRRSTVAMFRYPAAIPAGSKETILLDQTYLTTGYPELQVSGGKGASIRLGYAEGLYLPGNRGKGNRNEIDGKEFAGNYDVFVTDGGAGRVFRPLWWRTWRYLELVVETKDEPLTIGGVGATYTGYPFVRKARFDAGVPELSTILDVGWRTARLCAHEHYMDCPYYEQLQYAGDTRIQALVSMYMTGDARLARNAIEQLNDSRTSEGATYSRAPSRLQQYIPPFSLWWIGMVHDYWMYRGEPDFIRRMLPGARAVLSFFASRQQASGSLGRMPWWNFIDWTREWRNGVPGDESSAPIDMQLLLAYDWAAEMENELGSRALAAEYREAAQRLRATVREVYWDTGRRLFADRPDKSAFSQHANALAVLAGVADDSESRDLMQRVPGDNSLVQCSIYFRHYLHSALTKSGLGDRYLDQLGQWRAMLANGLTTWAERNEPSRSDCHAWGSSPNYELFRTVLGIDSAAPGFEKVSIRPHLGALTKVSGAIPHPKGEVAVSLELRDGHLDAELSLPVPGEIVWKGEKRTVPAGKSRMKF